MSTLAELDLGTTNLIFHVALLLTGLLFGFMGFRLIASGFRSPKSTVVFKMGKWQFEMTQIAPGIAMALIGAAIVIAGFYFIHPTATITPDSKSQREIT
jgi:putative Mn2+ efflux pump MntP